MDNLEDRTKEELIAEIRALKAHNKQLQNIILKGTATKPANQPKCQKPFDFQNCKFRHVLLKFLYLGWDYQGYVTQEDTVNTIEHHVFNALIKTCLIENRSSANYHRCGRTDKGVSSFSQVISLDLRSNGDDFESEINYCKILNRVLPENIQFVAWCPVESAFSARFDCKNRTYKYFFPKSNLDIDAMKIAANYLVGTHDFRNFCKMDVNNGVVEFKRNILSVDISLFQEDERYSIQVLTIKGNAFLWHQIRCIVGILILVGQGKEKPEVVLDLLDITRNPRKPDYHMASEIPLNLYDCHYDNVNWIYDKEALNIVKAKLYKFWMFSSIKTAMMKSMLVDLEKEASELDHDSIDFLIQGVKRKNYVPVMKRQLCESLEDKIQHSLKRRKRKANPS
ncbi:tRNA pseudouridine(38/39) synthase isoform X2 [Tribolium castaneum]|uniref:tRNA pseudouridine(38/39) synthase-like Protein n=1 Tax=Tribolium castaneum TaxID=7070 RepID=D2A375_TRICA|nr:PREDICTED: tRNA pseudouridine(38/39) synthase [Tribolium castaneum]EFA02961.2 tRNA pseudouridine(38/39) synthase-like Protein [Tribolium castaneum]|eukprot:XP_008191866.1 PREDICTED: tRNA pseudouridine(38/39) synthase [Tribolium castaneum]